MSKTTYLALAIIVMLVGSCINFSLTIPDEQSSRTHGSGTGGVVGGFAGGHK